MFFILFELDFFSAVFRVLLHTIPFVLPMVKCWLVVTGGDFFLFISWNAAIYSIYPSKIYFVESYNTYF